ncbi:hypothetical protein WG899_13900 [Paucibacter sp. AS339]|uniref:hypothetical protein n=1 Tax=Paucibacter hankyongi TaxID=3133434 RepID=UPI0030AD82FF
MKLSPAKEEALLAIVGKQGFFLSEKGRVSAFRDESKSNKVIQTVQQKGAGCPLCEG